VVGESNACQDDFITEAAVVTTPPEIHLWLSTQILWPPNKKFVEVLVGGSATDDSGSVEVEITFIDEYGSAIGQVVPVLATLCGSKPGAMVITPTVGYTK
jgi:hypothetical protein